MNCLCGHFETCEVCDAVRAENDRKWWEAYNALTPAQRRDHWRTGVRITIPDPER